ncbi:hypothetical protein HPB52_023494 [Rhipicephalus sanguineus]|uniref:Uncharacterized protein n=1 Tax=Rhipicephalus sanguineus TaxID=34632 RepID=A0A9D4TBZ4_RHISA|nr:hypothetical protein HPB52_023494 [Rhipicephalus sanguineus]
MSNRHQIRGHSCNSVASQNDDTEERNHRQTFAPVAELNDTFFGILTSLRDSGGGHSADLYLQGNLCLRSGEWYKVCRQLHNKVNYSEPWLCIKVGDKLR